MKFSEALKKKFPKDKKIEFSENFKIQATKLGLEEMYHPKIWEKYFLWPTEKIKKWLFNIPFEIKCFIQRGKRGYSEKDVWDLHDYLLSWLPSAIRELRDTGCSYPSNPFGKKNELKSARDWKKVLAKMANGLEAGREVICLEATKRRIKSSKKKFARGFALLFRYFFNLWD